MAASPTSLENGLDRASLASKLAAESYRREISGDHVAPSERMKLEGIPSEYLLNMSDDQYLSALQFQQTRYSQESSRILQQIMQEDAGSIGGGLLSASSKPSFTKDEIVSVANGYAESLSSAVTARNNLSDYAKAAATRQYFIARFGAEEGEKKLRELDEPVAAFDTLFSNTVTSISLLFETDKQPAALTDGRWVVNSVTGAYTGSDFDFKFSIQPDGRLTYLLFGSSSEANGVE